MPASNENDQPTLTIVSAATSLAPATTRLTWSEICAQFPDEWVVLVDADWVDDHNFKFGTARVYSHRKHRREASADLGALGAYENVGCFFTGRIRGPIPRFGVS